MSTEDYEYLLNKIGSHIAKKDTNMRKCVPVQEQWLSQKETPLPYVFVADSAFALTENMLKPYAGIHNKGSKERVFNYPLSRARRIVENVFGIMSAVFRILR